MKSSLKKLQRFALNHGGVHNKNKERRERRPAAGHDELAQASQDMQDMKDCYDSLLSAAAATANSAYEFSEALQGLGSCLLQRTALNDDEESGRVLLMLGRVQFELQKLVDNYRLHIVQTITAPSESLVKELQTVEEMKRQCDDKRELYKFMIAAHREKGTSRHHKSVSSQDLQEAKEVYHEEANLFVFRLKSLKQGQSRSLLTQATRHHAAQLNFFRKGLKSLEDVEPHVKMIAEQQHIDYHFSTLHDDYTDSDEEEEEDDDDDDSSYDSHYEGELSFDYTKNDRIQTAAVTRRKSVEENKMDVFSSNIAPNFRQSAPIFGNKFEPSDRIMAMQPSSTGKLRTYVLPTPLEAKSSNFTSLDKSVSVSKAERNIEHPTPLWYSSPLESNKFTKYFSDNNNKPLSPTKLTKARSVLKESNIGSRLVKMPPPLAEALPNPHFSSDLEKIRRHAFSGPMGSSGKPVFTATDSKPSMKSPKAPSHRTSPKSSPASSPPLISPSKISELHVLPRPPRNTSSLIGHSAPLVGYSAPLTSRKQESYSRRPSRASPLPTPPGPMLRSFSIPSSSQRTEVITVAKLLEIPSESEEVTSPTLTPISNVLQR